jgi:glycosyltransferase involved in cell wall biosynthesis
MRVLVYLPVFNDETRIGRSVESVLSQSYSNWHLIISDNCSTDNTLKFIQPYLVDKRINCVSLKTHVSGVVNFNNIEKFISDYSDFDLVCWLGSDDYWGDKYYLGNLVSKFLESETSVNVKLVLPIFSKIPKFDDEKFVETRINIANKFYLFRVIELFRVWGSVNLIYGLYDRHFFIDVLSEKFSRLNGSNKFTDWWWAYHVLKKTTPTLCSSSYYFKDDFKIIPQKKISRIENLVFALRFIPDLFKSKLLLIKFQNFHDFFLIFIFALIKTFFDLLRIVGRTISRALRV